MTNTADTDPFDPSARWVRIVEERTDGMVEFEFAVGEPAMYVEMVMPRPQFDDFCQQQRVTPTRESRPEAATGSDEHEWDWNLHDARHRHFRGDP